MTAFEGHGVTITLRDVIDMVEATAEDSWQMDVVRSMDGQRNCFFGHLHAYASTLAPAGMDPDRLASEVWDWFEEQYASTYAIYPINDGKSPRYPQPTPRQRVLGFLNDLRTGGALRTWEGVEVEYLLHCGIFE